MNAREELHFFRHAPIDLVDEYAREEADGIEPDEDDDYQPGEEPDDEGSNE